MQHPILELENINKTFSTFFSLKNINLQLYSGETHILIGKNGSGKSCLKNIVSGLYSKDSGNIIFNGKPICINSPSDAKKMGIVTINEESSLFEHFSVAENIFVDDKPLYNKTLKIINRNKMHESCRRILKMFNINIGANTYIKYLSNLQRQLIELVKAFVSNAKIVIIDEPAVDADISIFCNLINEMKKTGILILIISHQLERINQIGDRITIIRDGEIIGTEKIYDINMTKLISMMSGIELKDRYPKLNVKKGKEILKVSNLRINKSLLGINFALRQREIFGITGLDASKTKIARALFGLGQPEGSEIIFDYEKRRINSPIDAIKAGIGYVTQDRTKEGLFNQLDIPKNILVPNSCNFSNKLLSYGKKDKDIVDTYIRGLRIKIDNTNDSVSFLSGGNQQKVLLSRWMSIRLNILILDEPTRGIDIPSKVDVYNLINELVRKGTSIILISSDINEILGMCDRIMVLYGGKIATTLERHQATHEKIMYYSTGGH